MGEFLNSIGEIKSNYGKADEWEQCAADNKAKKKYLYNNGLISKDKVELTKKRAEIVARASEIMDMKSEGYCENMEMATGGAAIIATTLLSLIYRILPAKVAQLGQKKLSDLNSTLANEISADKIKAIESKIKQTEKSVNKLPVAIQIASIVLMFGIGIAYTLITTKMQKNASRVGRLRAKRDDLSDIKNFATYTPEQIKKAKEKAALIPDEKNKFDLKETLKSIMNLKNDEKMYYEELDKKKAKNAEFEKKELTSEEIEIANEEKELIVEAIKDMNISAENYSENAETTFESMSAISWIATVPSIIGLKKLAEKLAPKSNVAKIIAAAVPLAVSLGITAAGTHEQKNAAKIGLYKSRKEMLEHPEILVKVSDKDLEKAKDIKGERIKTGIFEKIGENFKFLPKYFGDKNEYMNYVKGERAERIKLQEALKETELTEEQITDAKELQEHIFRAFDEIDEMSQRYSEDLEAGSEIAKRGVNTISSTIGILLPSLLLYLGLNGKLPLDKVLNKITNLVCNDNSTIKKAVNELCGTLAKDKALSQKFQSSLFEGNLRYFLSSEGNEALTSQVDNLAELIENELPDLFFIGENGNIELFKNFMDSHLKDTKLAKYIKNILKEAAKIKLGSRIEETFRDYSGNPEMNDLVKFLCKNAGIEFTENTPELINKFKEKLSVNFNYKNYKTMINTGIAAGAPIIGVSYGIPFAFNSWIANIQKKAGKVGMMKATEKLDKAQYFTLSKKKTEKSEPGAKQPAAETPQNGSTNLLGKYLNK